MQRVGVYCWTNAECTHYRDMQLFLRCYHCEFLHVPVASHLSIHVQHVDSEWDANDLNWGYGVCQQLSILNANEIVHMTHTQPQQQHVVKEHPETQHDNHGFCLSMEAA